MCGSHDAHSASLRNSAENQRIRCLEASPERGRRVGSVAFGTLVIVASVLWTLFWGAVALLAWAFDGDTSGWVITSGALAAGVLVFVGGISLVRGRQPSRLGWLAVAGSLVALLALPVSSWLEDREAAPVNRAVELAYKGRGGVESVNADCSRLEDNPDGSESWACDVEADFDYDVCFADITRSRGRPTARVHDCLNDSEPR